MNILTVIRKIIVPAICFLSVFAALPSHAAPLESQKFICSGAYGDATDSGLWDWTFTANSEADAANQAKAKYMLTTPGAWVNVFFCRPQ
ncbi:hypothetical protein OP862_10135 [Yersinia massiliensis]|jgi:hypothetical protein|uniref:Secreted protein n=2 Tax=Yersinia massiliensis TaxID=419257 RepID=A0A2R4NPE7_9GAMM|nr:MULTISPECIES: hypothetical protein [Yersinia]HEC1652460.1 hypothetical protein [Yersinia enterocolitica]AVX37992.1 hypothetical protein DA391_10195 [Yersinia massiliensis]MDA5548344.1 hypothetical protein [Yersinia massiliensis]NIL26086.1 hypothetical protein [Yersinia massiliensis]OWF74644.1 hypothetical protein B4902_00500 [Yersinia frederiksenii]